jgi:hypothetical protein
VVPGSENGTTVAITLSFGNYLSPGTTYYYRARASNTDGIGYGAVKTFTTAAGPGATTPGAVSLVSWPGFVTAGIAALEHPAAAPPATKPLTKKQKLGKALKACNKKPKRQRPSCRRQAKRKYR